MILKITELRIGNLVYCFGIKKIVGIKEDKVKLRAENQTGTITTEWVPIDSLSLEPIKLNKKWFEIFQFSRNVSKKYYEKDRLAFSIDYDSYPNGRTYFNSWCIFEAICGNVHELQNLYFELEGKELEYNFEELLNPTF